MDLMESLAISAAGMRVQGERLRVNSENVANVDSVSEVPGGDPYRRKTISFQNAHDRAAALIPDGTNPGRTPRSAMPSPPMPMRGRRCPVRCRATKARLEPRA